jgi:xylulokinase
MPLVLGVDSSTQSTKVEVRDVDDGTLVATGRAPHPAVRPPRSEQPPSAWWDALRSAVADTDCRSIDAIAIAGQQHGMVLLDGSGAVLRDAKLWNDTESANAAATLTQEMEPARWVEAVGSVPLAAFTIAKLAWLAANEPAVLSRVASVLLPHDYLDHQLTGQLTTDRGDASGTGYFDPVGGDWRDDLLERFVGLGPWQTRLPQVLAPLEPIGRASERGREDLGLTSFPLVGPGTGDNMAAALGIALSPGDIAISLGTSGTVFAVHATPTRDPSGTVAGFADASGQYLPLVCTLNATRVTASVARWLGVSENELDRLASQTLSRPGRVVLVPYLDGERTPNRPSATGTLLGLDTATTREQIARAAFEGVACGLLDGLDALVTKTGLSAERIVLVGGGAKSPAYQKAIADLSGVPVLLPSSDEHVALGACVQAAAVLSGRSITETQQSWGLGRGTIVAPDIEVDRGDVRRRYRAAARRDDGEPEQ